MRHCLLATLVALIILHAPGFATAQNPPALFRDENVPATCSAVCRAQGKLLTTLDKWTPAERLEKLFGPPFKNIRNKRFEMTWWGGEQVDLFIVRMRTSESPIGIAVFARGANAFSQSPDIETPFWKGSERLSLAKVSILDAVVWDKKDLETNDRDDKVIFANERLGLGFSPLMTLGKQSEWQELSFLFPLTACEADQEESVNFSDYSCDIAAEVQAIGLFWTLEPFDKIADGEVPSRDLLEFVSDYWFWGISERDSDSLDED